MRIFQFWVLMLCSCVICFFYVRQIFLSRGIDEEQRRVVDSQEAVSDGNGYENAWQQLAKSIYINGQNDPALLDILRKEGVDVRTTQPPIKSTVPGTTPTPPSVPLKAPVPPPHTGTP